MKAVDPSPHVAYMGDPKSSDLGMKPGLAWLPIAKLRVDPAYQREILRNGSRNIGKIAREFDWSLFGVVVVANIGEQLFAIVDGQHRTTAAAMRGVVDVPCVIIEADPSKQASAFAAINGAVTKISPLQIFNAEIAAGETAAVELNEVCLSAGVTICRYPVPANKMKPGQTLAVGTLRRALAVYGRDHLALTLRCITNRGEASIGMVCEPVIKAIAHVLDAEASWCSPERVLLDAMRKFDLAAELHDAEVDAKKRRMQVSGALSIRLFDFLDEEIGA